MDTREITTFKRFILNNRDLYNNNDIQMFIYDVEHDTKFPRSKLSKKTYLDYFEKVCSVSNIPEFVKIGFNVLWNDYCEYMYRISNGQICPHNISDVESLISFIDTKIIVHEYLSKTYPQICANKRIRLFETFGMGELKEILENEYSDSDTEPQMYYVINRLIADIANDYDELMDSEFNQEVYFNSMKYSGKQILMEYIHEELKRSELYDDKFEDLFHTNTHRKNLLYRG